MVRISAVYVSRDGAKFDLDYYCGPHTAFATRVLGPYGLVSIRVLEGVRSLDGGAPAFRAISEMIFSNFEGFERAMAEQGQALFSDLANCTDITPILQVCRLAMDER